MHAKQQNKPRRVAASATSANGRFQNVASERRHYFAFFFHSPFGAQHHALDRNEDEASVAVETNYAGVSI